MNKIQQNVNATVSSLCVDLIRYISGRMTGHWFFFFTLQGPLVTAETLLKQLGRKCHISLPIWLSCPLTLSIALYFADLYFFPPVFVTGVAGQITENLLKGLATLKVPLPPDLKF